MCSGNMLEYSDRDLLRSMTYQSLHDMNNLIIKPVKSKFIHVLHSIQLLFQPNSPYTTQSVEAVAEDGDNRIQCEQKCCM